MRSPILITLSLVALGCASSPEPTLSLEEERALTEAIVQETQALRVEARSRPEPPLRDEELEEEDAEEDNAFASTLPDLEDEPLLEADPEEQGPAHVASFSLRRGETLTHFARWAELPVEDIADQSSLELDELHPVGTEVLIALSPEEQTAVEERRERHRVQRVNHYIASRGGASGIGFHRVRTGESAWSIAKNSQGIPVWLLEAYNPSVDLERIRPGQELRVPLIDDTVAEAE
ncbi:MAG: LysM domain-containing protein [Deltaproteobacteria bacterium]|nr:MAG: LysM domain-containing protein [Deltaproteobacteria bacterium]